MSPIAWLTVTKPSNTPNLTSNGVAIYQALQAGQLSAVGQIRDSSIPMTELQAFYQLQDGDKFRLTFDFDNVQHIDGIDCSYYGYDENGIVMTGTIIDVPIYNQDGRVGGDLISELTIFTIENGGSLQAQVKGKFDDDSLTRHVTKRVQDYVDIEYHATGASYLTFVDGIRSEVFFNEPNFAIKVIPKTDNSGNLKLLEPIIVTRL